jgi:flagellar biosynthesis protein FliQ
MQVITIARLHAMYQQSRKMLIFLVAASLAIAIACGVMVAILSSRFSRGKF